MINCDPIGIFRDDVVEPLRAHNHDRLKHVDHVGDGGDSDRLHTALHEEIELLLINTEREHINELFRAGKLKDEARRRIECELDLREENLANRRTEE